MAARVEDEAPPRAFDSESSPTHQRSQVSGRGATAWQTGGDHAGSEPRAISSGRSGGLRSSLSGVNEYLLTSTTSHQIAPVRFQTAVSRVMVNNQVGRLGRQNGRVPLRRFMLDPRALWRFWWEFGLNVLIMFQVMLVPFELAFLDDILMDEYVGWLLLEAAMLVLFFVDMGLNFRTGVRTPHGTIDWDEYRAAWNYAKGWFILDLLAWLPALCLIVMTRALAMSNSQDAKTTALLRMGRAFKFKMMRVLRLAHAARLKDAFQNFEAHIGARPALVKVMQGVHILLGTALIMHFTACIYASIALEDLDLEGDLVARYSWSLWWASSALTLCGQVPPKESLEMQLAFLTNLCGVFLVGLVITWCFSLYMALEEDSHRRSACHKAALRFAHAHKLPRELREEMTTAIQMTQQAKQINDDFKELVEQTLTESLRRRIYGALYVEMFRRFPPWGPQANIIYGCDNVSEDFLQHLACVAKLTTYQADERVAAIGEKVQSISFITKGKLLTFGSRERRPQILLENWWFGEKVIIFDHVKRNGHGNTFWVSEHPARMTSINALECSDVLDIDKDDFMEAVREHRLKSAWLEPLAKCILRMGCCQNESEDESTLTLGCCCCRSASHVVWECEDPQAQMMACEKSRATSATAEKARLSWLHLRLQRQSQKCADGVDSEELTGRVAPGRPTWLPQEGLRNTDVPPEKWGMRLEQWAAFLLACCFTKRWGELEREKIVHNKKSGYVNMYQVCDSMVKPWTRGTGSSVALLMNNKEPLKADVMISHAWSESALETLVAVLSQASVANMDKDTVIWFCTFSQYQAGGGGDPGPTISDQLVLDPFRKVIESAQSMLVIHTHAVELYSRLWCVYEINGALEKGLPTTPAYSMGALQKLFSECENDHKDLREVVAVDTSKAVCSKPEDTEMITEKVNQVCGGFKKLDEKIIDFREESVSGFKEVFDNFAEWATGVNKENDEDVFEGLMDLVTKAAIFVGLRYLLPYAKEAKDDELDKQIHDMATDILKLLCDAFKGFETPPPGISPNDIPDPKEDIHRCLVDSTKVPLAWKLLRMSAGFRARPSVRIQGQPLLNMESTAIDDGGADSAPAGGSLGVVP